MRTRVTSLLSLALVAGVVTACRKKPEPPPAPVTQAPPPVITEAPRTPPPTPPPVTPRPTGPTADELARAKAAMVNTLSQTIFFDYDKSDLRQDARDILDSKVPLLQKFPGVRLRIAGHTDERGSDEYNVALGQRRAFAARAYLQSRGIDPNRVDVVSFGEERQAVMGEGEDSWSKNRRDEFEIVAGADQIKPANE